MWWTIRCPFHCLASSLQACPGDNNQRKLVWEKSSKFRLPTNITAYLLGKLFMIYVSPLPLLTSPVLHWFAFLHMLSENICFLFSLTSNHSVHSSEGHTSHIPSITPTKIHLPFIISCRCCRYLKSEKEYWLLHSIAFKNAFVIRKQQAVGEDVYFRTFEG